MVRVVFYSVLTHLLRLSSLDPNSIADPECPDESNPGINDDFPPFVSDLYASFVLTNPDDIKLQATDGSSDCYPFQDILDLENPYPESERPQCVKPNPDGYCAYVFEDSNFGFVDSSECEGRRYSMQTFPTPEDIPSNAAVTHKNACGVCSSAQDLSTRMRTRESLQSKGVLCGTRYFINREFDKLIDCWQEEGFTRDCAYMWAHFTASNAALCAGKCLDQKPPFNGPPPECEVTDCLKCGDPFNSEFDLLAGRDQPRSGITENIGRQCSLFYPVVHDPCPGQAPPPTGPPVPTMAPVRSAASQLQSSVTLVMTMLLVVVQA